MVRYLGMMMKAYRQIYFRIVLNHMAYRFDWRQTFPFTETVPRGIMSMAEYYWAQDTDIADKWMPLMQRLESYVMFPNIIQEMKRAMTPMPSVDLGPRLFIPIADDTPRTARPTTDPALSVVEAILDYIQVNMAKETAVIKSFIPFPLSSTNAWSFGGPSADIDRYMGLFNSGMNKVYVANDSGDPPIKDNLILSLIHI